MDELLRQQENHLQNTSHKLQSTTMIPFDNSLLVTPPPIVPMISKSKENNHRHDSNQEQDNAMNNNNQRQRNEEFWAEVNSEIKRRMAAIPTTGPFDCIDKLSGDDYLETLANFDLRYSTVNSLESILCNKMTFLFHAADSIELGYGLYLWSLHTYPGSINSEEIPPDAEVLHCLVRTITVVLHSGPQISFNVLVLGRIAVTRVPTYWIVVLDEEKHLWALRANGVDEEVEDDEDWMDDPRWPEPQYNVREDLFGAGVTVVRLCSLASLQCFRKSGQQFSPKPYYGAKCWTSRCTRVEGPAIAAAEES